MQVHNMASLDSLVRSEMTFIFMSLSILHIQTESLIDKRDLCFL